MYYRRKLLLALIEAFGGNLKRTDCQKLLFLFCQTVGKNHYDFFPYQFGAFSFVAYYDKSRLTEMGLLQPSDDFQLRRGQSFISQLTSSDNAALKSLRSRANGLRGKELIRKTYLDHPHFACRSKIASELLNPAEIKQVKFAWNTDTAPCLFTIGYEGLTVDAFLNRLIANNVLAVIDVRNNPQSMKYGFSKKTLGHYIESAGMKYIHIPELGIPSPLRKGLSTPASYRRLFEKYELQIIPKQALAVTRVKSLISEHSRVALVCFESNHLFCHRHKIVEFLRKDKSFRASVVHL